MRAGAGVRATAYLLWALCVCATARNRDLRTTCRHQFSPSTRWVLQVQQAICLVSHLPSPHDLLLSALLSPVKEPFFRQEVLKSLRSNAWGNNYYNSDTVGLLTTD